MLLKNLSEKEMTMPVSESNAVDQGRPRPRSVQDGGHENPLGIVLN